ncbi:sensor histidine kinase [Paenibacillus whitsoniae]|uniref:histidine kinase n=1 Tax=Paenibacillus whitsoniae TaxID=2496558 RepID=A0A3S0ARL7_9BACL|nr:ATP-binding protein [Paenibacillus whitsoniae]RTE10941.1 sensor histidine kinase [Paenibacillus whitsoniae]
MFNKTRRQLVVLNSVVLMLFLVIFGIILYVHIEYRLLHQADEAITNTARAMQLSSIDQMLQTDHPEPDADRDTSYLFWDGKGRLLNQYPKQMFSEKEAVELKESSMDGTVHGVTLGNRAYRMLGFANSMSEELSGNIPHVSYVVVLRSFGDANHMLATLRSDLLIGFSTGVLFSFLAGFYLAGRSLIPIRRSWEKQQQFVADASHELRTPIAVIQTRSELMFKHPQHTVEEESKNIALILKESKRLRHLVEDLLTLARTDSNQLQIHKAEVPVHQLLQEITEQFTLLAETKFVHIRARIEPSILWGDEQRLRQLFIILLDNALKFTPPEGIIEVNCHHISNSIRIVIKDSGSGISEEDLPRIFERFYRGDKSRSRSDGGTGLGLSIAEWIVAAHKGTIGVQSQIAKGTEFQIVLPKKQ